MIIFNNSIEDRNFYYVTGIEEPCKGVFIQGDSPVVIASPLDAGTAGKYVETRTFSDGDEFWKILGDLAPPGRVGLNFSRIPVRTYKEIRKQITGRKFFDIEKQLSEKRAKKSNKELARLKQAGKIASRSIEEIREFLKPGISESDVKAELEYLAAKKGAEGFSFETMVSSGPRSALPHSTASGRKIKSGDVVMIDFGPGYRMYASDITRTFSIGRSREFESRYNLVLEAQSAAVESVEDGADASGVQKAAERIIGRMAHLIGHGVGLDVHEAPRFSGGVLEDGMVFTIEPAVYDGFGVRLEDTVFLDKKARFITDAPRSLDFAVI